LESRIVDLCKVATWTSSLRLHLKTHPTSAYYFISLRRAISAMAALTKPY
jgi:hypothetical protein